MVKVLYILGMPRSGSTLLDNVTAHIPGFFPVGELRRLWHAFASDENWVCGCGELVRQCDVWVRVVDEAFEDRAEVAHVVQLLREVVRERHGWLNVPRLISHSPDTAAKWPSLEAYGDVLRRVYKAIVNVTGCRVIVDSSKEATDALVLTLLPDVSPYFVHLVRDLRGLIYSIYRRPDARFDEVQPKEARGFRASHWIVSSQTAGAWMLSNLSAETVVRLRGQDRSVLLRYEDFVSQPWEALKLLASMVGEPFEPPAGASNRITLPTRHTVHGNSRRFQPGPVELREDDEWVKDLHPLDRLISTTISLPLLLKYQYPLRRREQTLKST